MCFSLYKEKGMKTDKKNKQGGKRNAKRESLKERVHRHLNDINSKITDDDIRNVRTELEIRGETNPESTKENKENETDEVTKKTTP